MKPMNTDIPKTDAFWHEQIARLRRERQAVIIAHNYQPGEIQDEINNAHAK